MVVLTGMRKEKRALTCEAHKLLFNVFIIVAVILSSGEMD
jgi:hypothetical protein